ncbi:hypothetical protein SAMN06295970_1351 [Noviherbaspirillum suwonense]|uniref:Uncharacterized protein n=1 Tax=Noviherbaspirillum suwonense TaxID=1224511 RepID=A0ABY1QT79_9BURK|nr:hypothetical protein SAMN06295970_1351 [Noviherbaspirillum suwonense]
MGYKFIIMPMSSWQSFAMRCLDSGTMHKAPVFHLDAFGGYAKPFGIAAVHAGEYVVHDCTNRLLRE